METPKMFFLERHSLISADVLLLRFVMMCNVCEFYKHCSYFACFSTKMHKKVQILYTRMK